MMNEFNGLFMTLLTNVISPSECLLTSLKPIQTVLSGCATLPARVIFATPKFRLPFSFTPIITKCLFTMKATNRASNIFATPRTLFCKQIRPTLVWLPNLTSNTTFYRTKLLASFASICNILTALSALVDRRFTPSSLAVAFERAIFRIRSAVKWMIGLPTRLAGICNSINSSILTTHTYIIPHIEIEERYCETAVKRLRQGILSMEIK